MEWNKQQYDIQVWKMGDLLRPDRRWEPSGGVLWPKVGLLKRSHVELLLSHWPCFMSWIWHFFQHPEARWHFQHPSKDSCFQEEIYNSHQNFWLIMDVHSPKQNPPYLAVETNAPRFAGGCWLVVTINIQKRQNLASPHGWSCPWRLTMRNNGSAARPSDSAAGLYASNISRPANSRTCTVQRPRSSMTGW